MANKIPRVPVREQDPQIRATNFEEVCYGYDLDEARLEASRCLHCRNPRCVAACPVSIRIPDFIGALHTGELQQAADIIAGDSSLPSICGRVCPQESQCEGSCILGIKGEPVAIGKLERFIGDWKLEHGAAAAQAAGTDLSALTWGRYFLGNMLPVTLGNTAGGGLVGLAAWYCYLRKKG